MNKVKSIPSRRVLGAFTLTMINVAAVVSLRGLPSMAYYGLSSIFYYLVAAVLFLIPTSLVSAELATGWPERGGIYIWARESWGKNWGFLAIWLQWLQNVIWFPIALAFAAGALAFAVDPALAESKVYMLAVILALYWAATLVNFLGMEASGWVSAAGAIIGTLLPGGLIVGLGGAWLALGRVSQIPLTGEALMPDLSSFNNLALSASALLYFTGMEMSAAHAQEVVNPRRDYPRAILVSAAVVIAFLTLGTVSVALVVPKDQISLVAGVMEALRTFLSAFGLNWLIPIVALMVVVGAFGQISTWIVGPTKGLLAAVGEGCLPPFFYCLNCRGMHTNILLFQGALVSGLSLIFLLMPTASSSFWILTALTTQLYLAMYVLMFASAIRLRYTQPQVPRAFVVPGGKLGMWLLACLGVAGATLGIAIAYVPPGQLETGDLLFYEAFLILSLSFLGIAPFIIYRFRRPEWVQACTLEREPLPERLLRRLRGALGRP